MGTGFYFIKLYYSIFKVYINITSILYKQEETRRRGNLAPHLTAVVVEDSRKGFIFILSYLFFHFKILILLHIIRWITTYVKRSPSSSLKLLSVSLQIMLINK